MDTESWDVMVEFFELVDAQPEHKRAAYIALLHRNFAAVGYPAAWPGFAEASRHLQERLALGKSAGSSRSAALERMSRQ